MEVRRLGQVFTPTNTVQFMLGLRRNKSSVLEPSCGDGAFLSHLESTAVGVEVDQKVAHPAALCLNFFDYPVSQRFDTIVGNPPYVAFKHIQNKEKLPKLFDKRTNLYLFFINKCLDHLNPGGELIFITPRDFMKLTAARHLNARLWQEGSFTDFHDLGDEMIFSEAAPNCAIWRWEKGRANRTTQTRSGMKQFHHHNGQIFFTEETYTVPFSDLFFVRVGATSGADRCFLHPEGEEFVYSATNKTGAVRKMIYDHPHPALEQHKNHLLRRKIKRFDESNWFRWGRGFYQSDLPRVYVNCKTRLAKPFFIHPCKRYDGSVMAIFCRQMAAEAARDYLNSVDWNDLGFKVGGRYVFNQRSLENSLLPTQASPTTDSRTCASRK